MTTSRSPTFALVRLVLHAIAVVVAVLTLPYLGWSARHGRRGLETWIVLCIASVRQGVTGIGIRNPRLLRPSLGHCIGAHIVTLIILLGSLLTLLLSQWGRESPLPRLADEDQLEEEDNTLMRMTLITGSLACGLQLIFSICACIDYHRMRRKTKLEKAANT